MITIIICAIIGLIIGLISIYDGFHYIEDIFLCLLGSFMGALIGAVFGLLFAFIMPIESETETRAYTIETLQDNSSISGNFFIGSGNINGKFVYTFYYKENGGYYLKQIDAKDVRIEYVDSNPYVEEFTSIPTDNWKNKFGIDVGWCSVVKTIIYVPKGTIKQNYTLDAK